MAIRLFSTLCILILIAKPSETPIQLNRERVDGVRRMPIVKLAHDTKPEDTWEPEMPMPWLVRDTRAFGVDGTMSPSDQPVNLRLTYQEWLAIYFDALGLDKSSYEEEVAKRAAEGNKVPAFLTEFDEEIRDFPLLSRIRGPFHDAVFEPNEVGALHEECLQVQDKTSNPLALEGIKKLLLICDRAQSFKLSIYLVSNAS